MLDHNITKRVIGNQEVNSVDARDLYRSLGVRGQFGNWVERYTSKFTENQDWIILPNAGDKQVQHGGHNRKDYAFTLDMAKHVAMMSETAKGFGVRQAYIDFEKKHNKPQSPAEALHEATRLIVEHEHRITELEQYKDRVHRVEAKQQAFEEGHSYFTVLGYCAYKGINVDISTAAQMGKHAAKASREQERPIDRVRDARFGMVNAYHETVLDTIISELL